MSDYCFCWKKKVFWPSSFSKALWYHELFFSIIFKLLSIAYCVSTLSRLLFLWHGSIVICLFLKLFFWTTNSGYITFFYITKGVIFFTILLKFYLDYLYWGFGLSSLEASTERLNWRLTSIYSGCKSCMDEAILGYSSFVSVAMSSRRINYFLFGEINEIGDFVPSSTRGGFSKFLTLILTFLFMIGEIS